MVFFLSVHSEGEQTADEVSVDFINLWSVIIPYNGAIRKEGGYPERDGEGEEEEEELQIFTWPWQLLMGDRVITLLLCLCGSDYQVNK